MSELLQKPHNLVDVYKLLPEGTPVQVIDNQLYMSPAPNFSHFETVDAIVDQLKKVVSTKQSGRVIYAPVDVFLGTKNAIQPDIFYISNERKDIIKEEGVFGAPDIVIEVLSPGNIQADLVKKKAVYEEFGIPEYFISNPEDKSVVSYYLVDGIYVEQPLHYSMIMSRVLNEEIRF